MDVFFVLVNDIANDLITAPAHNVVILPPFQQKYLGAIVFCFVIIVADKTGLLAWSGLNPIEKILFITMAD